MEHLESIIEELDAAIGEQQAIYNINKNEGYLVAETLRRIDALQSALNICTHLSKMFKGQEPLLD